MLSVRHFPSEGWEGGANARNVWIERIAGWCEFACRDFRVGRSRDA